MPANRSSAFCAERSFAERVGFEPTIPLRVYHLSRVANSTTLAPLRVLVFLKIYADNDSKRMPYMQLGLILTHLSLLFHRFIVGSFLVKRSHASEEEGTSSSCRKQSSSLKISTIFEASLSINFGIPAIRFSGWGMGRMPCRERVWG